MFEHEITILRDTFGRLLRRQAHTCLLYTSDAADE